ncbi:MAG: SPASM domain-containing protein [Clostridiales bacterium]|nr:SPASM domain-containing protein [Clostridiales bacterium]
MMLSKYLQRIKSSQKRVVLYGAGKIGKALKSMLEKNNILPQGFVVSDKNMNKDEVDGLKVFGLDEVINLWGGENILALVAVKEPWNNEVVAKIKSCRNLEYLDIIPELLTLDIKPELFEINAVVGCSVACKYCPQSALIKAYSAKNAASPRVLSFDVFRQALDKIPVKKNIAFSGFSEPFLNPDITKMIKYAHEKGHGIMLNTTLVGMTKEKFAEIRDIPIANFTLHLPDKDNYAKIPITEQYIELLKMVLDWKWLKNGSYIPVVDKANGQGALPKEVEQIIHGKVLFHSELADRAGNLADSDIYSIGTLNGRIRCNYSPDISNFVMMPNGDVYLCCMDFGLRHKIGNILEQSYEDLLKSSELQKIRKAMDSDDGECLCRHCTEAQVIAESKKS